jgi:hypothetical protein
MTHGNKVAVARLNAGPSSNIADFGISAAVCDSYMVPIGHRYVDTRALRERATRRAHVIEAATLWLRGPAQVGRVVARFSHRTRSCRTRAGAARSYEWVSRTSRTGNSTTDTPKRKCRQGDPQIYCGTTWSASVHVVVRITWNISSRPTVKGQ